MRRHRYYPCLLLALVLGLAATACASPSAVTVARLKYGGGGDWYANPTSLPNLLQALRSRTEIDVAREPATVSLDDEALFLHPILHMTGHGRVAFTVGLDCLGIGEGALLREGERPLTLFARGGEARAPAVEVWEMASIWGAPAA